MSLALLAATLASSIELKAQIVGGHVLQVLLVPHGSVPVVMTTRTFLGCYIEVQVQDAQGSVIGHIGQMAQCPPPPFSEFRVLATDDSGMPSGSDVFGVEFDLLARGRVRLDREEPWDMVPGQDYRFVVFYHNYDVRLLNPKRKGILRRRYGNFWSSPIELTSPPISFTCPS